MATSPGRRWPSCRATWRWCFRWDRATTWPGWRRSWEEGTSACCLGSPLGGPVGHTEQHARHLPMSTDTLIIEAIALGAASGAPDRAETLPVFPYGASTHRRTFAGTFNMGGRTFEEFMLGGGQALGSA